MIVQNGSAEEIDRASDLEQISKNMLWLVQPERVQASSIPVLEVVTDGVAREPNRYKDLGNWMINRFADFVISSQAKVLGIDNVDQAGIIKDVHKELTPGLDVISEYHELAPRVAIREGISDIDIWGRLALSTSEIAKRTSVHGGDVLFTFRRGIALPGHKKLLLLSIDPRHFRLSDDRQSIVPNFDLKEAIGQIKERDDVKKADRLSHRCPAHFGDLRLGKKATLETDKTMVSIFEAYYLAYSSIAKRIIYPNLDPRDIG